MTPSPPPAGDDPSSSQNKFRFRLEGRNAGVGAFHVIPINEDSSSSSSSNNNDSQEFPLETATVEFVPFEHNSESVLSQQEQESPQRGAIESRWSVKQEEERVERAVTSTTSIRDAYVESIKRKSCICLSTLFVSAIAAIVFTLVYTRGEEDGNREFRGTSGAPTASPTERNQYCDETRLLPAIDSGPIATRTDRFQALQSVLETELVDYDPTAFDDPCGPHNFALQWLADEDEMQLEPDAMEAVYQRFVVALFYFSTNMYSTILASHSNRVQIPWLSREPECTWFGITCTTSQKFATNKIISIELPGIYLKGSIPNALVFHLDFLAVLDLSNNKLNGTIPTSLHSSSSLGKKNIPMSSY
uniref:Leucine-rich repeat-containing N-terminal plant-type domain-containing protein n=1 Tax=Attheya septentrionalis TaxID=420275 RepID=A0A7S2XM33_9STRA|mmetsp:Transcript_19717/g.35785  ORF Transcript_19717/g.35785 Transcript_19717/m.35785 type:complete len:360 (+) Transcript_19717:129-1208(+)